MGHRFLIAAVLGTLLVQPTTFAQTKRTPAPAAPASAAEVEALRKQVEALAAGQAALQKQLNEIRALVQQGTISSAPSAAAPRATPTPSSTASTSRAARSVTSSVTIRSSRSTPTRSGRRRRRCREIQRLPGGRARHGPHPSGPGRRGEGGGRQHPSSLIGFTTPGETKVRAVRMIRGAQPFATFKATIDQLLAAK